MDQSKTEENLLKENIIQNHKFNFYQQFLVISIDPKIMYSINNYDLQNLQEPYSIPKVISKYPNINLPYLIISDSIIASHCFPKGIINEIIDYNDNNDLLKKENHIENFIFSLENMSPEVKVSSLRTNKVYYTCLLFYENIENYRNCINHRKKYSYSIDSEELNKKILIPKVICLSSFNPFYEQTKYILQRLKNYVDNFNYNNKSFDNLNIYPIEKIIEGLIFNLPSLPRGNFSLKLNNDSFSYKKIMNNEKKEKIKNVDIDSKEIIFQENPPNMNPRDIYNYSILMKYFRIEEVFEVLKFIILEEPILFFSEDKEDLTIIIESLISLIYPLQYPHPVIAILPEQNYSLISLFKHFIFGINYKYSEDILIKKIILDGVKFIRIIRLDKRFNNILNSNESDNLGYMIFTSLKFDENKPLIKFDQIEQNVYKNEKEDIKLIHEKKKINLPRHYLEKCCRKIEKRTEEKMKEIELKYKNQNEEFINKLKINAFNSEIRDTFLYFFCSILLKYQEYCVKYEKKIYEEQDKDGNFVEKEFEERNIEMDEKYYMKKIKIDDMFNVEDFINSTPSLDRQFYRIFFGTKIFLNFMKKKIFPDSNQDKLDVLYFDEIINKKLSRELHSQKKETKFLDFEFDKLKNEIKIDSLKKQLDNNIKQYLYKKINREKALNYFQYIYFNGENDDSSDDEENTVEKNDQIYYYYYVFPILLNDGIFYNEKYKDKNNNNLNVWSFFQYSSLSEESNILYNLFEEESSKIIDDENINKNYIFFDYSLNPTSQFRFKNDYLIKMLWLLYLSKTFKSIPLNKKRYYFEILMNFIKKNKVTIDENILLNLFNSINNSGDRWMNQDIFPYMKNKTYASYLCGREKMKLENNFIKFIMNKEKKINKEDNDNSQENEKTKIEIQKQEQLEKQKYEEKKYLNFIVNSFCTTKIGEKDLCNELFSENISNLFSDQEEYIKFTCNKCQKKQNLKIACKINNSEEKENYIINFELLSPMTLLNKSWIKNNLDLNPYFICENYLECYLSAIFYFYEQNLPCNFLMPQFYTKSDLKEDKNNYYSIVKEEEFFDEQKIKKIVTKNNPNIEEEDIIIFDEEENEKKEDRLSVNLDERIKEVNNQEIENILQLRTSLKKQQSLKSSFRKNKSVNNNKKKNVDFKLNLTFH